MNFVATNHDSNTFHGLLAVTAMGIYLLLVVGAMTAFTDTTAVCSAWPACDDGFLLPVTLDGWVALGHRIAAVLVSLLTVATLVSTW